MYICYEHSMYVSHICIWLWYNLTINNVSHDFLFGFIILFHTWNTLCYIYIYKFLSLQKQPILKQKAVILMAHWKWFTDCMKVFMMLTKRLLYNQKWLTFLRKSNFWLNYLWKLIENVFLSVFFMSITVK